MRFLFKHSLRLWLPNLLGFLLSVLIILIGIFLRRWFSFLATGDYTAIEGLLLGKLQALPSLKPVAIVTIMVGLLLYLTAIIVGQAITTAGAFGSSISTVYLGISSFSDYFRSVGRHFWKMTLLQLASIPVTLPLLVPVIGIVLSLAGSGDAAAAAGVLLLIIFGILAIYLYAALYFYSPVLMIRKGMGVWKSIGSSLRIAFKMPGQTLITLLAILGVMLAFFLVFPIIFFALATFDRIWGRMEGPGIILVMILLMLFVSPPVNALIHLIIVKRYKEKIQSDLFPEHPDSEQGDGSEPVFNIKKTR